MTKFLDRPKCTCFKSDTDRGEGMSDTIAALTYEFMRNEMNSFQTCKEAAPFILVKTFTFIADCVFFQKCDKNEELANKERDKFFAELPEMAKHLINELNEIHEQQGKKLQ